MSNRAIRKQIKKLGGKADSANVERAAFSINTTAREKALRKEQARERGVLDVAIDPASVSDPRRWWEGRPLDMRDPRVEAMKRERDRRGGDRFRG